MRWLIAAAIGLQLVANPALAVQRVWDGGGGMNNTWSLPANWNPDGTPTSADDLLIDVPGDFTVKCTGGFANSLICKNKMFIQGGATLNIAGQVHFGGGPQPSDLLIIGSAKLVAGGGGSIQSLTLSQGGLVSNQVLSITEKLMWGWSWIEGGGKVIIEKDAVLEISNSTSERTLAATLDVYGDTLWIEGSIKANENGRAFNNFGNFIKSGPGTWGFVSYSHAAEVMFNNHGNVEVQNGTLRCTAGTHQGSFNVSAGCHLHFDAYAVSNFEEGSSFTGAGNITLECALGFYIDSHYSFHGEVDVQGNLTVYRAVCDFYGNVNVGGTLKTGPGYTTMVGPTVTADKIVLLSQGLNLNCPATVVNHFELWDGLLGLNGDLYVNHSFSVGDDNPWFEEIIDGPGRLIIQPQATSTLSPLIIKSTIENYGAVMVGICEFENGTIINNGSMNIVGGWFEAIGGYGHIINHGVLTHTQAEFFEYRDGFEGVHLTNHGTVDFKTGITDLDSGLTNLGDIIVRQDAECRIWEESFFAADSTTAGPGNIRFGYGNFGDIGQFSLTGKLYLQSAHAIINNPCAPSAVLLLPGAHIVVNHDQQWSQLTANNGDATLSGPGDVLITTTLSLNGSVLGPGTLTLGPDCATQFSGGIDFGRNVENFGTITWISASVELHDCTFVNEGIINIGRNNTSLQQVSSGESASSFINQGVLKKVLSNQVSFHDGLGELNVHNLGIIDVTLSKISFGAEITGTGQMHVFNGGRLEITADSEAQSIANEGALAVLNGAQIVLSEQIVQGPSGQLEIAGGDSGLASIVCGETASLAGAVKVTRSPLPPPNSSSTILQAPTIAGTFESLCLAPPGLLEYGSTTVTFTTYAHGDANGDNAVDVSDLITVINSWGSGPTGCAADLNASGAVNVDDLIMVIANWN